MNHAIKLVASEQVFEDPLVKVDAVAGDVVSQVNLFPEIDGHQITAFSQAADHLLGQRTGSTGDQNAGSLVLAHQNSLFLSLSPLSISRLISAFTASTRSVTCSSGISVSSKYMGSPKFRCTLAGSTTGRATGT